MPVLSKRLKQGGVFFENHVAALPVCGPSRSSLLYGRYPHNTKYYDNCDYDSMQNWAARQNDTIGRWLAKSGYHTAFLGKYGACPIRPLGAPPQPDSDAHHFCGRPQ